MGIISWLKDLGKRAEGDQEAVNTPFVQVQTLSSSPPLEDLSGDAALVAVITAAIYAYEESLAGENYVPADGIIVRTIKKANRTRWQRPSY